MGKGRLNRLAWLCSVGRYLFVCVEAYNDNVIRVRWACQEDDLLFLVVAIHLESGDPANTSAVKKRYIALQVKLQSFQNQALPLPYTSVVITSSCVQTEINDGDLLWILAYKNVPLLYIFMIPYCNIQSSSFRDINETTMSYYSLVIRNSTIQTSLQNECN